MTDGQARQVMKGRSARNDRWIQDVNDLADRHQERADRLAECSRQTAFRDSAADLIADTEFHAETVAALREGVRRRTATFENTERDRLAWRDRAWKAESERDAALAEVERLIADGQQDAPIVDDATRQEVEALIEAIKAMRPDPSEPAPLGWDADDREGDRNIYRAAELLAAAYLPPPRLTDASYSGRTYK